MISISQTDLVIFDCDGVLVDSEPLSNALLAEHITRLGWPMTGDESMQRFKGGTMNQVHNALERQLGQTVDSEWLSDFRRDQLVRFQSELRAIRGVKNLIARVHTAGLKSCVASQGPHEKMAVSLGATGLLETFRCRIFSAVDVPNPKPAPDLFLHAAKQMIADPERCIVIEDSPTGITGARRAGMRVIGYDAAGDGGLWRAGVSIVNDMDSITISGAC